MKNKRKKSAQSQLHGAFVAELAAEAPLHHRAPARLADQAARGGRWAGRGPLSAVHGGRAGPARRKRAGGRFLREGGRFLREGGRPVGGHRRGHVRSDGAGGRGAFRRVPGARPLQWARPARPALSRPPPRILPGRRRRAQRPHLQCE